MPYLRSALAVATLIALASPAQAENVYQRVSTATASQHLDGLVREIQALARSGKKPVIVLDIDGTLLHGVYPRTMTFTQPVAGATAYTHRLANAGAKLVYLTARPDQYEARTRKQLARLGVPLGGRHEIMIKPADLGDVEFKEQAAHRIDAMGTMLALFDNELENLRLFQRKYPRTKVFRLGTYTHSDPSPARGLDGMIVMKDFAPKTRGQLGFVKRMKRAWSYRPAKKTSSSQARKLASARGKKASWGKPVRR